MPDSAQRQRSTDISAADQLLHMILGVANTQAIFVIAKLGVADLLKDGRKSIQELARATNTHTYSLYRVMRGLANQGVFSESPAYHFDLNPKADLLRTDSPGSLRGYAIAHGSGYQMQGWSNLLDGVETGGSAFQDRFKINVFEYFRLHPEDSGVFNDAMTSISKLDITFIRDAYDFRNFHTIVDVGGSHGYLLAAILKSCPLLRGILFDLPSVVKNAHGLLQEQGVSDRCQIIGGDFTKEVPRGGDAYILKRVIVSLEDESASRVLECCREAMLADGRVLIIDPTVNSPYGNLYDILMLMIAPGGRMRTATEYQDLLSRSGFKISRVVPTDSYLSIVEGVPL